MIRTRRDGDRIKIKEGYKKINDLFIDKKIPIAMRDKIILALDNDEVLMAFGVRKSAKVKDIKSGYRVSLIRNEE